MKIKSALAVMAAIALTASITGCADSNPAPSPETPANGVDQSVNECPRADGEPCR